MKTEDFYFDLPEEKIAQIPLKNREQSKLLLLEKKTGNTEHRSFKDIIDYLEEGDCIILNNTRVLPARLFGKKKETGTSVEFLLLKRTQEDTWETLVKPGRRAKIGSQFIFGNGELIGEITGFGQDGTRIIKFTFEGIFEEVLDQLGEMPLPPYITEKLKDKERYQTVYSKNTGSAAAPTAGLHFTKDLLEKISERGVKIGYVTLHVGLGTFRPVKVESLDEHDMHSEYFELDSEVADLINDTKKSGKKVIAVGTTSVRTLESSVGDDGLIKPTSGFTKIFIYPGYEFKVVDKLVTNFHLPESTLIMLVSALAGKESTLRAYEEAIDNDYRFFSFGDAMFIY